MPVEPPPDRPALPAQPDKGFDELVVPADSVLGLQIGTTISSDTARVEDAVDAHVTRDVSVGGRVAIPAGSRVLGSVTLVEKGGKVKERGRLGVRFHTLVLTDGARMSLHTDTVHRESASQADRSAAKIGGAAIGGAILGAIIGGGKGAAIGSGIGAAGGTAAVMAGRAATVTLPAGTIITIRLLSPVAVPVDR